MRCKRCGQEMKIKSVEVGKDEQGNPIYNDYAFCYACKIKVNLEKKAAKAVKPEPEKEALEEQEEAQEVEKVEEENLGAQEEDLGLTKRIELEAEMIKEETEVQKEQPKKRPPKKHPEHPKKKAERKPKDMPEKRMQEQPTKKKAISEKESRRQHEKRLRDMPEKRVKEVETEETRKKKGKGIIGVLVTLLIIAAIGTAVYFNRATVKEWINIGLEKFDSVSDNKDDDMEESSDNVEGVTDSEVEAE